MQSLHTLLINFRCLARSDFTHMTQSKRVLEVTEITGDSAFLLQSCWLPHDRCQRYSNECQSTFQGAMLRTNHWSGPSYGAANPPYTLSSPPLSSCSRGLRRLINVNVFSLLKPIRCTLSGHAQQNITLFRRTAAPSLPSLTPQQSHLSKSRGRLAFGRDWPSG